MRSKPLCRAKLPVCSNRSTPDEIYVPLRRKSARPGKILFAKVEAAPIEGCDVDSNPFPGDHHRQDWRHPRQHRMDS